MRLLLDRYMSELSELLLLTDELGALRASEFADHHERMNRLLRLHYGQFAVETAAAPAAIVRALDNYFGGETGALDQIQVATGGTAFQREVWKGLRAIPYGETISYGELASNVGRAGASRAVGAANGANPIAIVVPCHRVIGAAGTLTGYGGGLPRKQWLLDHERRYSPIVAGR